MTVLRAILFDFDGVIADSEPSHLRAFQAVMAQEGVSVSEEDYTERYLGLDDRACLRAILRDAGKVYDEETIEAIFRRKSGIYLEGLRANPVFRPGAPGFIRTVASRYPLMVASGALREEIEYVLAADGLRACFVGIVSAEDVRNCKPDPEPFLTALSRLNGRDGTAPEILPGECLVIEDAVNGIVAAHGAGMRCLAVAGSCPAYRLGAADAVVQTLETVPLERLRAMFL